MSVDAADARRVRSLTPAPEATRSRVRERRSDFLMYEIVDLITDELVGASADERATQWTDVFAGRRALSLGERAVSA